MPWTRRTFVSTSTLAAGTLWLPRQAASAEPPPPGTFRELRRNVGIYTAQGGTIGWLAGAGPAVVVDSQFPETARIFLAGLRERTAHPIAALVNTHHHPDHTAGNGALRPEVKAIVAHRNVEALQRRLAEERGTAAQQTYADTVFESTWRLDLGAESVAASWLGAAHSRGDAIVHFERADVVHLGDLVFNRRYPVIDRGGGASIQGWIDVLGRVHAGHADSTLFVFGHGGEEAGVVGARTDVLLQRDFLAALLDHVRAGLKAGRGREEIVGATELPGFPDHRPRGTMATLERCLGAAFDELTAG